MIAGWPRLLVLCAIIVFGDIDAVRAQTAGNSDAAAPKWEQFLDLYGGYATTNGGDVEAEITTTDFFGFTTRESGTRSVSYDPSFVVGGRLGVFYDFVGFALDTSYFRANDKNVQSDVVSISALLMFRLQLLTSDDMPNGRLQPYVGFGPAYFLVFQDLDFRPEIGEKLNVWSDGIGFDARAGVRWFFGPNAGLFAEYRIAHADYSYDDKSTFLFSSTEEKVKGSLTTQQILGGLTLRF